MKHVGRISIKNVENPNRSSVIVNEQQLWVGYHTDRFGQTAQPQQYPNGKNRQCRNKTGKISLKNLVMKTTSM